MWGQVRPCFQVTDGNFLLCPCREEGVTVLPGISLIRTLIPPRGLDSHGHATAPAHELGWGDGWGGVHKPSVHSSTDYHSSLQIRKLHLGNMSKFVQRSHPISRTKSNPGPSKSSSVPFPPNQLQICLFSPFII